MLHNNKHYNPAIVKANNLRVLAIINSTVSRLIERNIVVQAWKLHGIILISTTPVNNFGSD